MPNTIDGINLKIRRAEEHIQNINTKIARILTANPRPYTVEGYLNSKATRYFIKASGHIDIPLEISLLAGEAIHHLRSALDHTVTALIRANTGREPTEKTEFPIKLTPKEFRHARSRGAIDGIPDAATKIIEAMQPYATNNKFDAAIWFLSRLDNINKHRSLIVAAGGGMVGPKIAVKDMTRNTVIDDVVLPEPQRITNDGAIVGEIIFAEPSPGFHCNSDVTPYVLLEAPPGGPFPYREIISVFKGMHIASAWTVRELIQNCKINI